MSKIYFCSKCNTQLTITRRALPKFNRIIEVVYPHICPDIALPLEFEPNPVTTYSDEKTVQKSNDLRLPGISTEDLRDRRSAEHIKGSSAPLSVIDMIKTMQNSIPEHDTEEDPENG